MSARPPLRRLLRRDRAAALALTWVLLLVALAALAPLVVSLLGAPGPYAQDYRALSSYGAPTGPSLALHHLLGVDPLGRDLLSRLLYGARVSLVVALTATGLSLLIGTAMGLLAGYLRGIADVLISRTIDLFFAFPALLLALGLAASCSIGRGCVAGLVHPGLAVVIVVIVLVNWTYIARLVRGQVLSLREREFVLAAEAIGSSPLRIITRELLPNLTAPIIVYGTLAIPQCILMEAALSYLGVGVQPPRASWGAMLAEATPIFNSAWWYMAFPGIALLGTVLAFNVLGDRLQEALAVRPLRAKVRMRLAEAG